MDSIFELVFIVVAAVAGSTVLYRVTPFKALGPTKPRFTLFPKYTAHFGGAVDELENSLRALGFHEKEDGVFSRGKVYGDFSANAIKLTVEIDKNEKQIKVYASVFGILFDTGDIWQVTADILRGRTP